MAKRVNLTRKALEDVGDTAELGGLLVKYQYEEILGKWKASQGREPHAKEIKPLVLTAFMLALSGLSCLYRDKKLKSLDEHRFRALREADALIPDPVPLAQFGANLN